MAAAPPVNVCVLFYSLYGHTHKLAVAVAEGVAQVEGCTVTLLQVPETLQDSILEKANAKQAKAEFGDVPVATFGMLKNFDAIIVGTPTRFGDMCGQMRTFWDQTGPLWAKGLLQGKVGSVFVTTSTQHGGMETTCTATYNTFAHHGMIIVPLGYTNDALSNMDEITGGSPYGAGSVSRADGKRDPSPKELDIGRTQGRRVAETTRFLVLGRRAAAS